MSQLLKKQYLNSSQKKVILHLIPNNIKDIYKLLQTKP